MTLEVTYTIFRNAHDNRGCKYREPWAALGRQLAKHQEGAKDGPAISCGTFSGTRGRGSLVARTLVALDVEAPKGASVQPPAPADAAARLEALGLTGTVWTTHSHANVAPRYRVLVPLTEPMPLTPDEMGRADGCVPRLLAQALNLEAVTDFSKSGSESLFFLPRHEAGSAYWSAFIEGSPLAMSATRQQALEMAARLAATQRTADRRVGGGGRNASSWPAVLEAHRGLGPEFAVKHAIDGWNLAHPLEDVLVRNGYVRAGRDRWRSPLQTGGNCAQGHSPAVSLRRHTDGRVMWTSFSNSDDAAGLGAPAPPGCPYTRFGESFDIAVHFDFGGDYRAGAAVLLGRDKI
jgi:hypothetical protein